MQAFGREIASRTVAGVLAGVILAALASTWASIKYLAPSLAASYHLSGREASAWAIVVALSAIIILQSTYISTLRRRRKPSFLTTAINSGVKASITLTNHGDPVTYRVDGRIVCLVGGHSNPQPAPFRCELQVGGIKGEWEAVLKDGEWANIILGTLEPTYPNNPMGVKNLPVIGHTLAIRRGKIGQHVLISDAGAVVELDIRATPQLSDPIGLRQFQLARQANTILVTEVGADAAC